MAQHALLSASAADRWMHCTRAPRLEADFPDTASDYAAEGTLAHAIAELKLRKLLVEPITSRQFSTAMKKLKEDPLYQPEMEGYTDAYVSYINDLTMAYPVKPFVDVEARLDFSSIVPEGFGTGDCIVIGGDILHIVDFKYGKGVPVFAEENPQMRLYGLGALLLYCVLYEIKRIRMTVFQPRLDSVSEAEMTRDQLLDWAAFEVKPRAALAFAGEGEFVPGDWCRWCRAKAVCAARALPNLALEDFKNTIPPVLSDDEIGIILARGRNLAAWLSDLEDYALSATLEGKTIPGWKAVEGRSVRKWTDIDAAFQRLAADGWTEAQLYRRDPITLTDVEKLLGKKQFDDRLAEYVAKAPGKPTLVPESDKRPPLQRAASDFAEVVES